MHRPSLAALATALLLAAPAAAQVRSVRLGQRGGDFTAGRLEPGLAVRADGLHAARGGAYASAPLDTGLTFSAIGPHWKGAAGVALELSVSPDGRRWGRWIAVPSEEAIAPLREDGTPNPLAGATKKGRAALAAKSGLSEKLILEWVNRADLYRVTGIGTQYADLLENAGVDTVVELAGRKAENLVEKMKLVNAEKKLVRQLPALSRVQDWVAQAKKLPRKVSY